MEVKLAFGIPTVVGVVVALIIGTRTAWSTDLWGLPLFMGIFVGMSFGLAVRKHKTQKDISFIRRHGKILETEMPLLINIIVELIIFVFALVCASLPISAKRGILFGEWQITTRTILIIGALLVGFRLTARMVKWLRHQPK